MAISVVIVSEPEIIRYGIKGVIKQFSSENIRVIGEAKNSDDVLRMAKVKPADMYLLGFHSLKMECVHTALQLKDVFSFTKIILLSFMWNKSMAKTALQNGADGFVLLESSPEEIIHTMYKVFNGKSAVCPYLSKGEGNPKKDANKNELLTKRQEEVLQYICKDYKENEIADELCISSNTVHVHKTNIMRRLGIHSSIGLLRYGFKNGIGFDY